MTRKQFVSDEQAEELVKQLYERASSEEPSSQLDERILQQARASVAAESSAAEPVSKQSPLQFWQRFGSIAATLVLVVTVGMLYQHNRDAIAPEEAVMLMSESRSVAPSLEQQAEEQAAKLENKVADQVPAAAFSAEVMIDAAAMSDAADDDALSRESLVAEPTAQSLPATEPLPAAAPSTAATAAAPSPAKDVPVQKKSARALMVVPQESLSESISMPAGAAGIQPQVNSIVAKSKPEKIAPSSSWEASIARIREAIAAGNSDLAKQLWQDLPATYPNGDYPEDLVLFFGDDHQRGQTN